jgi:hypothetical protein
METERHRWYEVATNDNASRNMTAMVETLLVCATLKITPSSGLSEVLRSEM